MWYPSPKGSRSNHKALLVLQRDLKKVIDVSTLEQLQRDIAKTLVRLEMHFPPTYFDISLHLLIHLVDQIRALGPMYLHQMFPFERLMKVFRRYLKALLWFW